MKRIKNTDREQKYKKSIIVGSITEAIAQHGEDVGVIRAAGLVRNNPIVKIFYPKEKAGKVYVGKARVLRHDKFLAYEAYPDEMQYAIYDPTLHELTSTAKKYADYSKYPGDKTTTYLRNRGDAIYAGYRELPRYNTYAGGPCLCNRCLGCDEEFTSGFACIYE